MPQDRKYIAIDLKSFYASVECVDRGLNPLTTNLVVADVTRTEKTIKTEDSLVLDLVAKKLVTDQVVLNIGYDTGSLSGEADYSGEVVRDWYGRDVPKPAHGSINLGRHTSSTRLVTDAVMQLFDRIVDPSLLVRRLNVVANNTVDESMTDCGQLDLFDEPGEEAGRERRRQEAILEIKRKFGKNAILKGMNFEDGATAMERNGQVGGHKA